MGSVLKSVTLGDCDSPSRLRKFPSVIVVTVNTLMSYVKFRKNPRMSISASSPSTRISTRNSSPGLTAADEKLIVAALTGEPISHTASRHPILNQRRIQPSKRAHGHTSANRCPEQEERHSERRKCAMSAHGRLLLAVLLSAQNRTCVRNVPLCNFSSFAPNWSLQFTTTRARITPSFRNLGLLPVVSVLRTGARA